MVRGNCFSKDYAADVSFKVAYKTVPLAVKVILVPFSNPLRFGARVNHTANIKTTISAIPILTIMLYFLLSFLDIECAYT